MKSRLVSVLIVICLFLSFALQLPLLAYAEEGKDPTMPYELSGGYEWEYIGQHMDYYANSFSDDIVPMQEKIGLGMLLEDSQSDLSDTLYGLLDNAIKAVDLTGIVDAFTNGHKYPINFTNEYSLVIFQLMTNDLTTNGLQDAYCGLLQDSVVDVTSTVAEKLTDLFDSNTTDSDIISQMTSAMDTLKDADPNSNEFMHAWEQFAGLCSQYIDFNQMTTFCDNLLADLGDAASILGSSIDELKTIGDAYRYICFARSYLELSDAFKTALDKLASMAYDKARYSSPSKRFDTDPYADENQYYNLYSAITAWTEKADEYQKDALAEFAKDVSEGTLGTSVDLLADAAIDVILPGFGQIKAALSLGKLGIDLFSTIDDEYKQSVMVSCLDHITTLMIEVAEYYVPMIGTIDRDKTGDGTGKAAWMKMTPYDQAVMFDESINIYKSAMKLACEYGMEYEQSKLNFATSWANGTKNVDSFFATCFFYSDLLGNTTFWQEQASLSSSIIEALAVQKLELDNIQCHDDALFSNQSAESDVTGKPTGGKVLLGVNEYDSNDELVEKVSFDYNDNGLISRSYHDSYLDGLQTEWGYDYIYTYDEAGRLISRYYYVDQWGSGFEDVIRSYDSNGSLVSDNMYGEGEVSVEKEYAYGEGGRLIWERAINGSPFLGGKVENEYSYSYHTGEQGQIVGVRHNETDPSAEDKEVIYNAAGQLIQEYKSELAYGAEGKVIYEYLDDSYFCIRDEFSTFSYPYDIEETRSTNIRYAIILDSAGQEIESFTLGSPETAQMSYDEDGYLASVDNIENVYYVRCEFIYGEPGEEPRFENASQQNEQSTSNSQTILTQEEAYALAVAGSGFEDGEMQTTSGSEFVIQFWDCGRAGYNGRSVYVYQVRRLRKIEGPQMTQLMETVLVDAITGECIVISPAELLVLDDDPLSENIAGGETSASENESSTQEAHPTLTVTGNGVNIRSGPGTSYESIGSVNKGDILFSKGKSDNWYMVEYGNTTGYIIEDYVTIEHGGFYTAVDSGTLSVNGTNVNIRSGPGTEYQSIGSVSSGTTLTITGKSDNWYQVNYNGRKGYIIEDYVIRNN